VRSFPDFLDAIRFADPDSYLGILKSAALPLFAIVIPLSIVIQLCWQTQGWIPNPQVPSLQAEIDDLQLQSIQYTSRRYSVPSGEGPANNFDEQRQLLKSLSSNSDERRSLVEQKLRKLPAYVPGGPPSAIQSVFFSMIAGFAFIGILSLVDFIQYLRRGVLGITIWTLQWKFLALGMFVLLATILGVTFCGNFLFVRPFVVTLILTSATLVALWEGTHKGLWRLNDAEDAAAYQQECREYEVKQQEQERQARERTAADQAARARAELLAFQNAALRRKEALSRCELHFHLYQADIATRFTRAMFDDYMRKFMTDSDDIDTVERRGRELQAIIEKHYEQAGGTVKPRTFEELSVWFSDQKRRIENAPMAEEQQQMLIAMLEIRYADLSQQILEHMQP
jgi:hypothetical protein